MSSWRIALLFVATSLLLGACATRPINPPITHYESSEGIRLAKLRGNQEESRDVIVLAFSGGGTRAAAFSYGVLEALRSVEIVSDSGEKIRLLDKVDLITGVSGGSFTALAYGLYGDKLFDMYEKSFLKRNVQGELVARILDPLNWPALSSKGWGRSELAAQLYDEILFKGATFADLKRAEGPAIAVSATELSTGSRVVFIQQNFDIMCADLGPFSIARAAAASSAVPVVLSPLTINNYGGTCGYYEPDWVRQFAGNDNPPRAAERVLKRLQELREFNDARQDPFFHLVDGGVSDNLGLRGVLDFIGTFEALRAAGKPTPLDNVRRIIIFVVNSISSPTTKWNQTEDSPGTFDILTKAAGVPIDHYSGESVELLKDIDARWTALRELRDSARFANGKDPNATYIANAPNADIYVIDVSFRALEDKAEYAYLNQLPTSFHLPDEAVDRLRAAARTIILDSTDFQRFLKGSGAHMMEATPIVHPEEQGSK